jgi:hypothetical protein
MAISLISTILTEPFVAGGGNYSTTVVIGPGAGVEVSATSSSSVQAVYLAPGQVPSSIMNFGTIVSETPNELNGGVGIVLASNADVNNYNMISGSYIGILSKGNGTISNLGQIEGGDIGVAIINGEILNNALVSGATDGILLVGSYLYNLGNIYGGTEGVSVRQSSSIGNQGVISATSVAIYLPAGGTVQQGGTLIGNDAILSYGTLDLSLTPLSKIEGNVLDTIGNGTLWLNGADKASVNLNSFSGFSKIGFQIGSDWSIEGGISDLASQETIVGFSSNDTIILDGFAATTKTYVSGQGLILSDGTTSQTIDLVGDFTSDEILISHQGSLSTEIVAPCFLKGTRIEVLAGKMLIEELKIGDYVKIVDGRYLPIKWIGRRSYDAAQANENSALWPIEISESAISNGVPCRNMIVSPDHGIFLEGVLIKAELLKNDRNIRQKRDILNIEYFHIELESHEIIIAENCPTESFWNFECRSRFENFPEYEHLYPFDRTITNSNIPVLESGFRLFFIKSKILKRLGFEIEFPTRGPIRGVIDEITCSSVRGWVQDIESPETPVLLEVYSGSHSIGLVLANEYRQDLKFAGIGSGCHAFSFPLKSSVTSKNIAVVRHCDGAHVAPRA